MKKTDSDIQYAVSIKEDTAYLCLHFTKDHEGNKINTPYPENPIRRIQAMEIKYSGRYRTWSLLQETPNTPVLVDKSIRRIHFYWIRRIQLSVHYSVFIQKINTAYSDLLNTAYRSSDTESKSEISYLISVLNFSIYLQSKSWITSITVNGKNAYELKGKFLDDLYNNAFSRANGEDAVEHIEYFLRIVDPIDLPNMNQDKPRVVVFPISLAGDAWRWFDRIKGSITRSDEIEPTNEKTSNLEKTNHDDEQEIDEIFRIETNLFDYETSLYEKFKEFNYLLKIDPDVLTKDIEGFKTYEEYKDDWIYEWNKDVPWVHEIPWTENGVWKEPTLVKHHCKPFNYESGYSEWPTCSWREDGYCNGGNLPGAYIVGNSLHYQDVEWYEALMDSKLKDKALRNKAIMEGLINEDDESNEERCELFDDHELPVCTVRRFEMIKYSFGHDEEYVAIKENEYEDLTSTSEDACRAYQEIFRIMDEGWMDLAAKKSTMLVKYL
ncbi:hypothetical protein Tco_0941142 [Tanacetum coccineum]|uniref:Uncharacterized protein n=1 Tax=Tanacetum coccineum TaxID=301880 RepID=A0ABQ5DQ71_9ASTR